MKRNFLENNNLLHNYVKLSQEYPSTHKVSPHQKSSSRLGINNIMKQIQKKSVDRNTARTDNGRGRFRFREFSSFQREQFPAFVFPFGLC